MKKIKPVFLKKLIKKVKQESSTDSNISPDDQVTINENLYYNKITKQYIVFLKSAGRNVSLNA